MTSQRLGFTLEEAVGLLDAGRHRHGRLPGPGLHVRARAKLAEVEAKIAGLQVIAAALRAAVDAGCPDPVACAGNPGCPIPFAPPRPASPGSRGLLIAPAGCCPPVWPPRAPAPGAGMPEGMVRAVGGAGRSPASWRPGQESACRDLPLRAPVGLAAPLTGGHPPRCAACTSGSACTRHPSTRPARPVHGLGSKAEVIV
jgi:hypothetical protein